MGVFYHCSKLKDVSFAFAYSTMTLPISWTYICDVLFANNLELEDISYLFDKDDISKLCFYLTSRNEYNRFLDEYVDESLGKDAIYISFGGKRERVCIPLVDDDEIERVVGYLKNN